MNRKPYINAYAVMSFLEQFGFVFSLDWDDELEVEIPDSVDPAHMASLLTIEHKDEVISALKRRRENELSQCVGGPFNGHKHDGDYNYQPVIIWPISRARWAVYVCKTDDRAVYVGETTSESKGRKLGWDVLRHSKHPMIREK